MGKQKKYFVKDESLHNSDDDYFRHRDIAANLRCMIDNTEAPFNIAIIGKWGLGKSSLINMVIEPMKKDKQHYIVQEINAWKYQKDELCRAFLKKMYQGISGEKRQSTFEVIKRDYTNIISQEMTDTDKKKDKEKGIKKYWSILVAAIITLCCSMLLFFAYSLLNSYYLSGWNNFQLRDFMLNSLLSYCRNIGSVFIIPLLIWMGKLYMDAFVEKNQKKVEVNFPLDTKDDYAIYLENKISELISEKPNIKIVTVIDDLDRLSIDKIVEALDAIKTFMDFRQCIFIVPFDDNILKQAINKEKLEKINKESENAIESELILDKLFQYKIYLPELIKIDIKDYASKLCISSCSDFICEYSNEGQMDKIIRNVLIHSNVQTPRQVKKILNVFINNVMIARKREYAGKVQKGFSSSDEGMRMIAKLSVLQADFNDFYDLLFIDVNAIDKLLGIHNNEEMPVEEHLTKYCFTVDGKNYIKKEYIPLVNYLSMTIKYKVSSMLPYLYMAQDTISVLTGDQKQQEFLAAVESNNEKTVRRMLEEIPELALALKNAIEFTDDIDEVMNFVLMSVNVFDSINREYVKTISDNIALRCEEASRTAEDIKSDDLDFNNLFLMRGISGDASAYDAIIDRCIEEISDDKCGKMIREIVQHEDKLTERVKKTLKNRIVKFEKHEDRTLDDLTELLEDLSDNIAKELFGLECFESVSKCIMAESRFDEEALGWFDKVFRIFIDEENINNFSELWKNMANYPVLHKLINSLFDDKELSWLDEKISNSIVEVIRTISLDKYEEASFDILSRFPFELNEDNCEEIDEVYSQMIDEEYFVLVVRAVGEKNGFCYLENTIEKLINNSFSDVDYAKDTIDLFGYFTTSQKDVFMRKYISNVVYVASKSYENEKKLVSVFEDSESAETVCSEVMQVLASYYNKSNYFELSIFIIQELCRNISQELLQNYLDNLLLGFDYFPIDLIKCIRNINEFIDESYRIKLMKKIIQCDNEAAFGDIEALINVNFEIFSSENENLSDPIDFYSKNYMALLDKKSALDFLGRRYSSFGKNNLMKLSSAILTDKQHVEYAATKIGKIINKLNDVNYIGMFIDLIDEGQDVMEIGKLMFSGNRSVDDLYKIAGENIDEWNKKQMDYLISSLTILGKKVRWKNCYLLLKNYLDKNQDSEQNLKALNVLKIFGEELTTAEKKKYIDLIYQIYCNTNSEDLKKAVISQVRSIKGTRRFKSYLSDEEKAEYAILVK